MSLLNTEDHAREYADHVWVYPVISRRAGGLSIGINLNPNNACNWHCVYCQVPHLTRGGPPPVDLARLRAELDTLLGDVLEGDFLTRATPAGTRLADIAFSGNGEPTSSREFSQAVALVIEMLDHHGLRGTLPIRLITNGSLIDRPPVLAAIELLGQHGGEIWFKFDAATEAARLRINGTQQSSRQALTNLRLAAARCSLWLQSCFFLWDGAPPDEKEICAWLEAVASVADAVRGVHLYGIARPSQQPEAMRLGRLPGTWLEALAMRVTARTGRPVTVSP